MPIISEKNGACPSNEHLAFLLDEINARLAPIGLAPSKCKSLFFNRIPIQYDQNQAAKIIQKIWRQWKNKQKFIQHPYLSYLSLVNDEENKKLAQIMYGSRVAPYDSAIRETNPHLDSEFYHRTDAFSFKQMTALFNYLGMTGLTKSHLEYYLPIHLTHSLTMENVSQFATSMNLDLRGKLHTRINAKLAIYEIDPSIEDTFALQRFFQALGLIATSWEIAICLSPTISKMPDPHIHMDCSDLPTSHMQLLSSKMMTQLRQQALGSQPTHLLSKALLKLLYHDFPHLDAHAFQRIALMIELTNTFYHSNYFKYADCIYAIVHEISLGICQEDELDKELDYQNFIANSKISLLNTLDLSASELEKSELVVAATNSGANAYSIALSLALKMQTPHQPPFLCMFDTNYYEFYSNTMIDNIPPGSQHNIMVLNVGAIVSDCSITPGTDLNLFIKRHIIDKKLTSPITLIVDLTSALYKNIKLTSPVKALIESGQLSLLFHESHQKFGLLHTDQAQHGRVFGICSKKSYAKSDLSHFKKNAKLDFFNFVDLRIGAYLSSACEEILEEIKMQHFSNGAIVRGILDKASITVSNMTEDADTTNDVSALYFATQMGSHTLLNETLIGRDSFGHFSTSYTTVIQNDRYLHRISPGASDNIDCLMEVTRIYLSYTMKLPLLEEIIQETSLKVKKITLAEQIIMLAMLHYVIGKPGLHNKSLKAIKLILDECEELKGRTYYQEVSQQYYAHKGDLKLRALRLK